jgi:hypothetical protein
LGWARPARDGLATPEPLTIKARFTPRVRMQLRLSTLPPRTSMPRCPLSTENRLGLKSLSRFMDWQCHVQSEWTSAVGLFLHGARSLSEPRVLVLTASLCVAYMLSGWYLRMLCSTLMYRLFVPFELWLAQFRLV